MAQPFIGQLSIFAFGFAPKGWALANGQTLPINQNQALFSLLGTTYGGDGVQTFQLPNVQGNVAVHNGAGYVLGQTGGEHAHTLTIAEMPAHVHAAMAVNGAASSGTPSSSVALGETTPAVGDVYGPTPGATMGPSAIANAGGSQAHQNLQPYLVVNFCIALQGIFPSRN